MNTFPIDVQGLTHRYATHLAVNNISFKVPSGAIFGLLGPNGAGKSTTVKILTTLLPATAGDAFVAGYNVRRNPTEVRQNIGYVPQMLCADGDLTGYENLLLSAKLYGLEGAQRKDLMDEVLEFMGLIDVQHDLVNSYSGGMIRRLEIAQSIVHQPHVLFLDEPTVGLDPAARQMLWQHLETWRKKQNTTILLTTHDMDEADALCDVVAFMKRGSIVAIDEPKKLKEAISKAASLDDAFMHYTDYGDYAHAKQARRRSIT
ncbi:MAG: ATP-binding cassette domain-containing protein [Verrucomicrobia bacterium]|nr:ATP-binding cassette domain-containing protein [Verrucomicrobiota bacterium]MBS0637918.1 ATP-binding cassette domain-containing protein [Verrucomicrobiota bacterium]